MINSYSQHSMRCFLFTINIISLKLQTLTPLIKFTLKIGNKIVSSQPTDPRNFLLKISPLVIQSELMFNHSKGQYQPIRSLLRVFSVQTSANKRQKEQLLGFADILINDYMFKDPQMIHEKQLLNCPDWTARVEFKLEAEEIFEQSSPLIKNKSKFQGNHVESLDMNELLVKAGSVHEEEKLEQVSILQDSIDIQNKLRKNSENQNDSNVHNLNAYIQCLKSRLISLELEKNESQRIIKGHRDKEAKIKISTKQLQKNFQTLKEQFNYNKIAYQRLLELVNSSDTPRMQVIQEFITCKKCEILRGEIKQKEKNFEQDLAVCERETKYRDDEINRLLLRIESLDKKSEVLKYENKQCEAYKIIIENVFVSLRQKAKQMKVNIPELALPSEFLKVPENLPSIFSKLLGRLQPHFGIVINGIHEDIQSGKEYKNWQEMTRKSAYISELQFELMKANEKINKLQNQVSQYKHERDSLLSIGTAKFGEISFGRKESLLGRRDSDLLELLAKQSQRGSYVIDKDREKEREREKQEQDSKNEQIQYLKKRNLYLEQILDHQQKALQDQKLQMTIQSNQLQINNNLSKRIQQSIQNQIQIQKQLSVKDSIIDNLRLTIDQYQQDVEELKEKLVEKQGNNRKSRQKLVESPRKEFSADEIEGDIKNLLMFLDEQEEDGKNKDNSIQIEVEEEGNLAKRENTVWSEIQPDIKKALQKKIKLLSIEFLKMKSLKVQRCKSKEETAQLMKDFINFRSRLEQTVKYVDNL